MPIVSLEAAKEWLGVTSSASEPLISDLLDMAQAFIEGETGRFFGDAGTSHTEFLVGNGTPTIWLNEPADSVTSVEERAKPGDAFTAIAEMDADGWEQRGRELLRKGGSVWSRWREYRVVYVFGYDGVPHDIRQVVRDLLKLVWAEFEVDVTLAAESIGDTSYTRRGIDSFDRALEKLPTASRTLVRWRGFRSVA